MEGKTLLPPVKWAQRKDRVFLTVEIRDIKNEKVDLQPTSLTFTGSSDAHTYHFAVNFFDEISVEESKHSLNGFSMQFILVKKDATKSYWSRLTKETTKFQHIQVDWTKYIDEDDEQEEASKGLEGWDENKFNDFQGGQDEDDEDDGGDLGGKNLDDLEEEEEVPKKEEEQTHEHGPDCKHE